MSCRVQHQFLDLAIMAVAFAHVENIFGLNDGNELVQPSSQPVSRALGCAMLLVCENNDPLVISALVF